MADKEVEENSGLVGAAGGIAAYGTVAGVAADCAPTGIATNSTSAGVIGVEQLRCPELS